MHHGTKTALVVDDEPADLEMLRRALADLGYEVITASDGRVALKAFHAHRGVIELLVTDVAMAPMNGCELAANLLNGDPHLRVVFVSGFVGIQAFRYEYGLTGAFPFLRKPFKAADLQAKIRDVLEAAA
jgi:two-component system cell cycle sensor histidine kinase/response regulator CckA